MPITGKPWLHGGMRTTLMTVRRSSQGTKPALEETVDRFGEALPACPTEPFLQQSGASVTGSFELEGRSARYPVA